MSFEVKMDIWYSLFLSNDPVTPIHSESENLVHDKIYKKLVWLRNTGIPQICAKAGVRKLFMVEAMKRKSEVLLEASKYDSGHPVEHCLFSDSPASPRFIRKWFPLGLVSLARSNKNFMYHLQHGIFSSILVSKCPHTIKKPSFF